MHPATQYNCLCCMNINLCWDLGMRRVAWSEKLGHWGIPDIHLLGDRGVGGVSVCVYVLMRHLHWSKWHLSHDKHQKLVKYIKSSVENMQVILSTLLGNTCRFFCCCCSSVGSHDKVSLYFLELVDENHYKTNWGEKYFCHESDP